MSIIFLLILFIVLVVIELINFGLVSVWFAAGAVAAFIISYFTNNSLIQISTFVVISIVSLIVTRPLVKRWSSDNIIKTNVGKVLLLPE